MTDQFRPSDAIAASQLHAVLTDSHFTPGDTVIRLEDLPDYDSIDDLFGDRYYKIIFLTTPGKDVGHWTLLTHLEGTKLEFFNSSGGAPPAILQDWCERVGVSDLSFSRAILQDPKSFHCGRFVLARISSQPTALEDFVEVLTSSPKFSADTMVSMLFNVDSI